MKCYGIHSKKSGFLVWMLRKSFCMGDFDSGIVGFATRELADEWFKKIRAVGGLNDAWKIKPVELEKPWEDFKWLQEYLKNIEKNR